MVKHADKAKPGDVITGTGYYVDTDGGVQHVNTYDDQHVRFGHDKRSVWDNRDCHGQIMASWRPDGRGRTDLAARINTWYPGHPPESVLKLEDEGKARVVRLSDHPLGPIWAVTASGPLAAYGQEVQHLSPYTGRADTETVTRTAAADIRAGDAVEITDGGVRPVRRPLQGWPELGIRARVVRNDRDVEAKILSRQETVVPGGTGYALTTTLGTFAWSWRNARYENHDDCRQRGDAHTCWLAEA